MNEVYLMGKETSFKRLFKVISVLGVGSFGIVLEVKNKITHEISALKVI